MPEQTPIVMTKEDLVLHLERVLAIVRADDSAGGWIEYEWSDRPGMFDVRGVYRVGNSAGQGGVCVLGGVPSGEEASDA